jgi:hypothetical protein
VCAILAAAGIALAGVSGMKAHALATRGPTAAELSAAGAAATAQRWEREAAGAMFPAAISYTSDLQTKETATRLSIGTGQDCASALDSTLRSQAAASHCAAGLRATYVDALGGTVYTVGVLAFPTDMDADVFFNKLPADPYPATGLNAMPVAGTAAARFGNAARQDASGQVAGPYVVLAVGGYADGRPASASAERRDADFDPADRLVSVIAAPLGQPVPARCGTAEFTCLVSDVPVPGPGSAARIRPYEMTMLNQISVPAAWKTSKGSGVTVAVLDTGVNSDAPDLQGAVTSGPDYTAGADPAGYVPPHLHGTYIASIIAGRGDGPGNSQGVIGVAPAARILSVRVILDDDEPGLDAYESKPAYANAIGKGIYYAVAHGAAVINMSLGSASPTAYLRTAVQYALSKGVVVVASAGNEGSGSGFAPYVYPASFSGVISVAAVTPDGGRASFSEQNASVILGAPGVGVAGDGNSTEFISGDGTSPASAFVAGVAALIKSRYPSLSPPLVEQALIASVTHQPSGGYSDTVGFGELNAAGALTAAVKLAGQSPATGLAASAMFTGASTATGSSVTSSGAGPAPIQVTHRDVAAIEGYSGLGALGAVMAVAALITLMVQARRGKRQPALAMPPADPSMVPEPARPDDGPAGPDPAGSA